MARNVYKGAGLRHKTADCVLFTVYTVLYCVFIRSAATAVISVEISWVKPRKIYTEMTGPHSPFDDNPLLDRPYIFVL